MNLVATRWIRGRGKRVLDLAIAIPAIVLLAPVTAALAILVGRNLGTPVLFRQERAGLEGVSVTVPKFRSMTDERDADGNLLPDERRITSFGAKLRSTSLDELPQLWSVVTGDMSIVGPRPLPTAYLERYSETQRRRLEARPGITGWAQVNGRNDTSWQDRLAHDVWYVDHASIWLDLRILSRTIGTALRRDGVSAAGHVTMQEFLGDEDAGDQN